MPSTSISSEICAAAGKRVVVGDLYIPGCPLERHHLNAQTDSAAYRYRRIGLDGVTITASPVTLSSALATDEWDFISFQQSSPLSGLYSSYGTLKPLMEYVDSVTPGHPVSHVAPDLGLLARFIPRGFPDIWP